MTTHSPDLDDYLGVPTLQDVSRALRLTPTEDKDVHSGGCPMCGTPGFTARRGAAPDDAPRFACAHGCALRFIEAAVERRVTAWRAQMRALLTHRSTSWFGR